MSHENDLTKPLPPEALAVENLLRQFAVRLPGESDNNATAGSIDRDRLMYLAGMAAAHSAEGSAAATTNLSVVVAAASKTPWYWPAATVVSSSLATLFLAILVSSKAASSVSPDLAQLPPAAVIPVAVAPAIPMAPSQVKTTLPPVTEAQALQAAAEQKKLQNQELRRICTMPAGSYFRNRYMALAGGLDPFAAPYQASIPAAADASPPSLPATKVPKLTPFGQFDELLREDGVL